MTSEQDQWKQIQAIFERAVELPVDDRTEFLDQTCKGDDSLRREVETLLDSFQPSHELEDPPVKWAPPDAAIQADSIRGYQILSEMHRGGQGVVYLALQESTKLNVAIKVMLEGPFAGPASRRRFEREIELAGSLKHPGIVAIFDSVCAR